jgi:FkbM family methyltransferase
LTGQRKVREELAIRTIALGRRLFANTPVQRLSITAAILRRVFRFGYGTGEIEVEFRGMSLVVPADDVTVVPGLVGGFYERIELDIFQAVVASASLIVDVGGNVGVYACLAAAGAPSKRVVTFEPVPDNLEYLRRNLERNGLSARVEVVDKAVSDVSGLQPIYLADSIGTHSLSSAGSVNGSRIEVEVITLDAFLARREVDVIKIDVEGFDGYALRGARELLESRRPTLFVEFVPSSLAAAGFDPREMIELISGIYEHVFLIDEPRATIVRVSRAELLDIVNEEGNKNLIAVGNRRDMDIIQGRLGDGRTVAH